MDIKQITHKLLSLIISSLIIYSLLIIFQNSSKAESCYRDANNKIVIGSIDSTPVSQDAGTTYDKDNCTEEPLNYKVKFYRVMLCTSEAYVSSKNMQIAIMNLLNIQKIMCHIVLIISCQYL